MESHLATQDSQLVSNFVHKIGPDASYVTQRREVKYFNAGGNSFSPGGVKVIRFQLTSSGQEMLDPLSCILQFKVSSGSYDGTANNNHHLAAFAPCFFRRIRVICGGTTINDIDYANREAHMMFNFAPKAKRENLEIMMGKKGTVIENSKTFGICLLAPIFMQDKFLPLNFMNMTIELELVDQVSDIQMKTADLPAGVTGQGTAWHIEEPVIMGNLVTLDSSLSNEFSNFLLKGKTLTIPMISTYTTPHVVTSGAGGFQLAMTRSLSRLRTIYQTYTSNDDKYVYDMRQPDLSANAQLTWQSQIGPTKYPSWGSLQTDVEKYWNLQQAVGTHQSVFHSNAIDLADWNSDSYIIGMNLCKVQSENNEDNWSSISTKMGDLLNFHVKNFSTDVTTAWTTLQYSMLMTISEEGCAVFD